MKDQPINRIRALQAQIEDYKNRLINKKNWKLFGKWLDEPRNEERFTRGVKKTSISNLQRDLSHLEGTIKKETGLSERTEGLLNKYEETARVFIEAVQEYLTDPSKETPFVGKAWYVYFFYMDITREKDKEPQLGRAVLRELSPGIIKIENVPGHTHKNYEGAYTKIHNQVYFLDLETKYEDRKLHVKVYSTLPEKDEILLGSYITYEDNHVVRGSLVMEAAIGKDVVPKILSYKKDADIFKSVHPAIRQFLSLRKYNYYKTPRGIHTYSDLAEYLDRHSENWESRFFEKGVPKLFIASPGLSVNEKVFKKNKAAIAKLERNLSVTFSNQIEVKIHNNQDPVFTRDLISPQTLANLKKARFFVLIYTKTDVGSYALVQFGWAMAYCKVVMMFYEEGSISGHVKTVPEEVIQQPFTDLEKDIDKIYETIELRVRKSLKRS